MTSLYRGMDRAALDDAYNNVKAIADFPTILSRFRTRSETFYGNPKCCRGLAYGKGDRQRYDLVLGGGQDAPTVVYVHGGYWQTLSKEDFAFVGEGPLAHGFNIVLAEYTLAPAATMTEIVDEIGRLLDHLAENRERLGIGQGHVALVGHSAGGHLTLLHRSHPLLHHVMAISPLVDLEPISLSWLNDKLQLTPAEVDLHSPILHIGKGGPTMTVAVGKAELPELVRHAGEYAATAQGAGEWADYLLLKGRDHFSVLEELASSSGLLMKTLAQALEQ